MRESSCAVPINSLKVGSHFSPNGWYSARSSQPSAVDSKETLATVGTSVYLRYQANRIANWLLLNRPIGQLVARTRYKGGPQLALPLSKSSSGQNTLHPEPESSFSRIGRISRDCRCEFDRVKLFAQSRASSEFNSQAELNLPRGSRR
jgi:hypothetical protein